jgi:hypothetical protein
MTSRALDDLFLSALFTVYVKEGGFPTVYAKYLEDLSATGTFGVILLDLCLAPGATNEYG